MSNKYEEELSDYASKLDAITQSQGQISRNAYLIVDSFDEDALITLFSQIKDITKECKSKEIVSIAKALYDSLIKYVGYRYISNLNRDSFNDCDERSLEELLADLNKLVGLEEVKKKVNDLIIYQKIRLLREEKGLFGEKNTLHLAFLGNPGTGKTTVARIIGRVYKQIGLLSKGHFIEASRTDLIAGYQGQTALKVKKLVERAKGGVLFIDEAYSITENDHSDSYGRECLTELTKALEDYRDDLVVIVAGYTEPMQKFFESNPGLKSRFNNFIEFPDYSPDELFSIMEYTCKKNDYVMSDGLKNRLKEYFSCIILNKADNFANGRLVRNVFNDIIMNQAKRLSGKDYLSKQELMVLEEVDFDNMNN